MPLDVSGPPRLASLCACLLYFLAAALLLTFLPRLSAVDRTSGSPSVELQVSPPESFVDWGD
jgi:hypothetical protein